MAHLPAGRLHSKATYEGRLAVTAAFSGIVTSLGKIGTFDLPLASATVVFCLLHSVQAPALLHHPPQQAHTYFCLWCNACSRTHKIG